MDLKEHIEQKFQGKEIKIRGNFTNCLSSNFKLLKRL